MTETEEVTLRQPVPLWLSAFLIALAVFSVGYTFSEQQDRENAFKAQRAADEADDRRVEGLVEDLQVEQERGEEERLRLRLLVTGLLTAQTPEERRQLLEDFVKDESEADDEAAEEDVENPPGEPSTNNDGVTEEQGAAPPDPRQGDLGESQSLGRPSLSQTNRTQT